MSNTATKYRVTMTTNAGAVRLQGARAFEGVAADCRHNGGRVVFMTTEAPDSLEAALEKSHSIAGYSAV